MKLWEFLGHVVDVVYSFIWRHTAGRPWTYPAREWVKLHPGTAQWLLPLIVAFLIAWTPMVDAWISNIFLWWFLMLLNKFLWLLTGHLFWDTAGKYIKTVDDFTRPKRYRKRSR